MAEEIKGDVKKTEDTAKKVQARAKSFWDDFKAFASRGNVIDLAIGIVIGTAFTNVTNALVTDVITPPIGLALGRINFSDLAIPLGGTVKISYGLFFQAIISFLITALALFIIMRAINRIQERIARRKQQEAQQAPAPADSPEVSILKEIRDLLKPSDAKSAGDS
jgi:large conductance mechanosensitive channel